MKEDFAPIISVVIVNYNTRELLLNCLHSLQRSTEELQIIVVDNASQDGSAEAIRSMFPEIELLALSENRGFCAGNNMGIARACGTYVLILNPDTEIEAGTLSCMANFMDRHPEYDGCTGHLHYPNISGEEIGTQLTCSRIPTFPFLLLQCSALGSLFPRKRKQVWQDYNYGGWLRETDADVEVVPGSCFMMRRGRFQYDERFFLYLSEESYFAQRLKEGCGWRLRYLSAARVLHHESSSTRSRFAQRIFFVTVLHTSDCISGDSPGRFGGFARCPCASRWSCARAVKGPPARNAPRTISASLCR